MNSSGGPLKNRRVRKFKKVLYLSTILNNCADSPTMWIELNWENMVCFVLTSV